MSALTDVDHRRFIQYEKTDVARAALNDYETYVYDFSSLDEALPAPVDNRFGIYHSRRELEIPSLIKRLVIAQWSFGATFEEALQRATDFKENQRTVLANESR